MKFPKGVRVPKPEAIHESYDVVDQGKFLTFSVNVAEEVLEPEGLFLAKTIEG